MCPDIADPINGQIHFSSDNLAPFDFETFATYSCDPGYELSGGNDVRMCDGNSVSAVGSWNGTAPSCTRESYHFVTLHRDRRCVMRLYLQCFCYKPLMLFIHNIYQLNHEHHL